MKKPDFDTFWMWAICVWVSISVGFLVAAMVTGQGGTPTPAVHDPDGPLSPACPLPFADC